MVLSLDLIDLVLVSPTVNGVWGYSKVALLGATALLLFEITG